MKQNLWTGQYGDEDQDANYNRRDNRLFRRRQARFYIDQHLLRQKDQVQHLIQFGLRDRPPKKKARLVYRFAEKAVVETFCGRRQSAQMIAAGMNGQITDGHDTLDGERAWRIQAGSQPNTPSEDVPTLEDLISVHNQRLYAIECDAIPGSSYHEQVNFVRDHWKWLTPPH